MADLTPEQRAIGIRKLVFDWINLDQKDFPWPALDSKIAAEIRAAEQAAVQEREASLNAWIDKRGNAEPGITSIEIIKDMAIEGRINLLVDIIASHRVMEQQGAIAAVVEKARDAIHKRVSEVYGGHEAKGFRHAFWRDCLNPVFDSLAPQSAQDALREAKAGAVAVREQYHAYLLAVLEESNAHWKDVAAHIRCDGAFPSICYELSASKLQEPSANDTALAEVKQQAVSAALDRLWELIRPSFLNHETLKQAMDKVREESK